VLAQNLEAIVAELEPEKIRSRLQVDEDNLLAAPQRLARKCSTDQARAGDQCGHCIFF
jgi:hypothetical protein